MVIPMEKQYKMKNYEIAKEEADKIDNKIIETLKDGKNFRVEAGAGSGKTYSLNKVIEWLQCNKWEEFKKKKQNAICITFTNTAVNVIENRLSNDSFIIPSTIHSFAWGAIKQYQNALFQLIKEDNNFLEFKDDFSTITTIQYELGYRNVKDNILFLHHDDIINFFALFLDNAKFRRIFSNNYPIILIDEYQDSFKIIIDQFLKYFISQNKGPQFGFFGDSWQTIYQLDKSCGIIENSNLTIIKKVSNFRSAPKIVNMLNFIRPELPQISAVDNFEGEVKVITCNDYTGPRELKGYYKGELPRNELKLRLDLLLSYIKNNKLEPNETIKTLMLTHKMLANQQGYSKLLEILNDRLKKQEDPFINFLKNTAEPIYTALQTNNSELLFNTLYANKTKITRKSEKLKWSKLKISLHNARKQNCIDVLNVLNESRLVTFPDIITKYYKEYNNTELMYEKTKASVKEFLDIEYSQFISAISFLHPETEFSTEHGVKGEEYDNVVFVISKGWTNYQFERYIPMILTAQDKSEDEAFIRNRNLFYVCCSRPKKRLYIFVSIEVDNTFMNFLEQLVGKENVFTYSEYIS